MEHGNIVIKFAPHANMTEYTACPLLHFALLKLFRVLLREHVEMYVYVYVYVQYIDHRDIFCVTLIHMTHLSVNINSSR